MSTEKKRLGVIWEYIQVRSSMYHRDRELLDVVCESE